MSPVMSDDLTEIVVAEGNLFVVLQSPDTAEHEPDYVEIARHSTREQPKHT